MYDAILAESITLTGHGDDEIEASSARTLQAGPVGGVVVIHHLPGYDRQTKEFTLAFAAGGLNAVTPNLYHREAPGSPRTTSACWSVPPEGFEKPCAQPGRAIKRNPFVVTELEAFPERFGRTSASLPLR